MVSQDSRLEKMQQIYAQYEQPMYRIAYAILHHVQQAEDATQDAFLKIMQNLERIDDVESAATRQYIVQIIRNTAINQYRKNAIDAQRTTVLDDAALQIPDERNEVEQHILHTETQETVTEILGGLSDRDREILCLRCQESLSFREIAARLSLKEATVRKRYERARKAAKQQKGVLYHGKLSYTK